MVATSLDSQNFLRKQYRHAMSNINYLVNRGCFVIHDRIIYNFPWAGFFKDCPRETAFNSLYHEVEQLRERLITIPDDTPYISSATTDETVETNEQISVPISDDAYTAVTIVEEHYDESKQIIHDLGGTSIDIAEGENIVFTVSEPAKENVYNCKECDQTTQDSAFSSDAVKWVPKDICAAQPKKKDKWIKHYCSSHKILLVGEGDFSFSACLAQAFGSATNMVATSLDSKDFLKKNYKRAMSNINYLKNKGCKVIHNMDATEMANNNPLIIGMKFNRIVYNFPLAGFFKGYSRKNQLKFNRNLVRLFMKNAKEMLEKDGEIHITHKSYGFYLEWDLEKLARRNGLGLIEDVEFELSDYPGYNNKYGFGGDDNFDCYGSQTYKFCIS